MRYKEKSTCSLAIYFNAVRPNWVVLRFAEFIYSSMFKHLILTILLGLFLLLHTKRSLQAVIKLLYAHISHQLTLCVKMFFWQNCSVLLQQAFHYPSGHYLWDHYGNITMYDNDIVVCMTITFAEQCCHIKPVQSENSEKQCLIQRLHYCSLTWVDNHTSENFVFMLGVYSRLCQRY